MQSEKNICKNVFKNDTEEKIKESFNQKWIALINHLEKQKRTVK